MKSHLAIAVALATLTSIAHAGRDEQAGVCAVYIDYLNHSKSWQKEAWAKAKDIEDARDAAEDWQHGITLARGTVKHSYLLEGQAACNAIAPGHFVIIRLADDGKSAVKIPLYEAGDYSDVKVIDFDSLPKGGARVDTQQRAEEAAQRAAQVQRDAQEARRK